MTGDEKPAVEQERPVEAKPEHVYQVPRLEEGDVLFILVPTELEGMAKTAQSLEDWIKNSGKQEFVLAVSHPITCMVVKKAAIMVAEAKVPQKHGLSIGAKFGATMPTVTEGPPEGKRVG